jgi:hypothetical protein
MLMGSEAGAYADRAAVDVHRQQWLHEYVGVARQVGEKRNADVNVIDMVGRVRCGIREVDCAVVYRDVGHRIAKR